MKTSISQVLIVVFIVSVIFTHVGNFLWTNHKVTQVQKELEQKLLYERELLTASSSLYAKPGERLFLDVKYLDARLIEIDGEKVVISYKYQGNAKELVAVGHMHTQPATESRYGSVALCDPTGLSANMVIILLCEDGQIKYATETTQAYSF